MTRRNDIGPDWIAAMERARSAGLEARWTRCGMLALFGLVSGPLSADDAAEWADGWAVGCQGLNRPARAADFGPRRERSLAFVAGYQAARFLSPTKK